MTTQEIRDELARMDGCYFAMDREIGPIGWIGPDGTVIGDHPHPATLDGAAAAMPEGWKWTRSWHEDACKVCWIAQDENGRNTQLEWDTGDEIHDRYALALAARKAQETHR